MMSVGIVIKGPEGLVLAAESRVTLGTTTPQGQQLHVSFDHANKLLVFDQPHQYVAVVTYGQAAIGLRTAHSFLPEFEAELPDERLPVHEFADLLSDFFTAQWRANMPADHSGPPMTFVVAGFNVGEPYGRVFTFDIPRQPDPVEQNQRPGDFGITWGGQRDVIERLVQGYDRRVLAIAKQTLDLDDDELHRLTEALKPLQMAVPLPAMPLQDCVDLAIFFVRTTIDAHHLSLAVRASGGPIDVAIITRRDGLQFIQRKSIAGERY